MEIIAYQPEYKEDFRRLNVEWLEKFFVVEPVDHQTFDEVESKILAPGGEIFFAKIDNEIVGTVAMINRTDGIYELSKMGVSEAHQAKGIGRQLMEHCIHWAKAKNLPAVMIETSTKLTPAIKLYQRMGFIEVPSDAQSIYERADYRLILPLTMTAEEALAVLDKQTCNA